MEKINTFKFAVTEISIEEKSDLEVPHRLMPKGIECGSRASPEILECTNSDPLAVGIFNILAAARNSDWFVGLDLKSVETYKQALKQFILFLNASKKVDGRLLKTFETERRKSIKERDPKSNGNSASKAMLTIKHLLNKEKDTADKNTLVLIKQLAKIKPSYTEREPKTLSDWFGQYSWLRETLTDEFYLPLVSTKVVISSLQDLVGVTLSFFQQAKAERDELQIEVALGNACFDETQTDIFRRRNRFDLLREYACCNEDVASALTCVMVSDFASPRAFDEILSDIETAGQFDIKPTTGRYSDIFYKKIISSGNTYFLGLPKKEPPNLPEQFMMSWLLASLAVQPSDCWKIKKSDFAMVRKANGDINLIVLTYYKTRSEMDHHTPTIPRSSLLFRPLLTYLDLLDEGSELIPDVPKYIAFTLGLGAKSNPGLVNFMVQVWRSKTFDVYFNKKSKKPLFLNALLAFNHAEIEGWSCSKECYSDYRKRVSRPLPNTIFNLAYIKTTAVYARTDEYRIGDYENYHSHTPETHRLSYMTDANTEWVNNLGRITRYILHDMENFVYQNKETVQSKIIQQKALTKVTNIQDGSINSLGQVKAGRALEEQLFDDQIIVMNSEESALNMWHYMEQVMKYKHLLAKSCPLYFEKEVLVTVEWIARVFPLLNADYRNTAKIFYEQHCELLPDLFEHHIKGGVST